MAKYLAEDQVGFDPALIGFPTLGGCMGLAIQTDSGLHGFHIPPGHEDRCQAFANTFSGQPAKRLLSCARWKIRYGNAGKNGEPNAFLSWLSEITKIAGMLKFSGPVVGLNLSDTLKIEDPAESAYCQFDISASSGLGIGFSLTSNTAPTTVYDLDTPIRRIAGNMSSSVPYKGKIFSSIVSSGGGFKNSNGKDGIYELSI